MPVRLDLVPALSPRPAWPRAWLWLGVLPLLLLLLGVCGTFLFGTQSLRQQPSSFWGLAIGAPLLGWCVVSFVRVLLYFGQQQVADGWDKARDEDWVHRVRRGRRVQQVLGVSLHTVLREPQAPSATQLNALLNGARVIEAQPSGEDQAVLRQSRLLAGGAHENAEQKLGRVFRDVLVELVPTLNAALDNTPLALLLEVDSALPENVWQHEWERAWSESGIRQSTVSVEGKGLQALDQWLDHRISDQALLMVVAIQSAPQQPAGTAEAAVGLLLGNRLTQAVLPVTAYLHRPEQEREPTTESLLYAARQALDWVPLEVPSIEHTWRTGIDVKRNEALSQVLAKMQIPRKHNHGFYDLDALLGHPGKASPWLAIAFAAQTIQCGAGPQFIFSGGGCLNTGLWSTVVTPVPSPLETGV